MKAFLSIALLSLSTLIGYSQVDTIIVTPNSPSSWLLTYPDSLGFNAKVTVRQPAPGNPIYECGYPNITLVSDTTPIAVAIVYSDDNATQWLSTQFLFNLSYNDSLHFCVEYVGDCYCAIDPIYDADGDGIVCDTMWNSLPTSPSGMIVASSIYKLQCADGVSELTNDIKLWPNPVNDNLTVTTSLNSGFVKVYSTDGKFVSYSNFYGSTFTLDTLLLDQGSYVIHTYDGSGKHYTNRFIK